MTDYPSVGRYRFSVTVADNNGQAYLQRRGASGPGDQGIRTPAPRFRRTVAGPVVHLASVPAEDVVPPGQCSNLALSAVDNQGSVTQPGLGLTWTYAAKVFTKTLGTLGTRSVSALFFCQ